MKKSVWFSFYCFILFTADLVFFPLKGYGIFPDELPNGFFLGPEIYYLDRCRQGGTFQDGFMSGARVGYERLKRCHWYWGVDGLYAIGKLDGHSSTGRRIKSDLTDATLEGRVGYTFQKKSYLKPFVTPFMGFGYFSEINDFKPPTPLAVKFQHTFHFLTFGVLTGIQFCNDWNIGLNFKTRYMLNGKCKVFEDPDYSDVSLIMENEFQYRLETPLGYQFNKGNFRLETDFVPFFEYRHFGGRENFPFDFIDTIFHLYGARLELVYRF